MPRFLTSKSNTGEFEVSHFPPQVQSTTVNHEILITDPRQHGKILLPGLVTSKDLYDPAHTAEG